MISVVIDIRQVVHSTINTSLGILTSHSPRHFSWLIAAGMSLAYSPAPQVNNYSETLDLICPSNRTHCYSDSLSINGMDDAHRYSVFPSFNFNNKTEWDAITSEKYE